ncbi:MAG: hypothetical protein ACLVHV_00310 [Oscillospiraceae bacterium]
MFLYRPDDRLAATCLAKEGETAEKAERKKQIRFNHLQTFSKQFENKVVLE